MACNVEAGILNYALEQGQSDYAIYTWVHEMASLQANVAEDVLNHAPVPVLIKH
jgi:hypothetical protein